MAEASPDSASKFDPSRAAEYEQQSRIALAGYDACHELTACMLSARLGVGSAANVLVVGAGGPAQEITKAGHLQPNWRFTAVDPSEPMLEIARMRIAAAGMAERTQVISGRVEDLPNEPYYDAATLIGVLHHLPGREAKLGILQAISSRLKPGAPLILAGNHYAYANEPLMLKAWGERWRMQGATSDEVKAKMGKILQGADPPHSEAAVFALLSNSGFEAPQRFFSSLFWSAWIGFKASRSGKDFE
jgi:tRNA (cmo5U34)-methyltransferase